MLKRLSAAALLAAFVSGTAMAQGVEFGQVDQNQDGFVSFEEFAAAVPQITEDAFNAADVNRDQVLDPAEFGTVQL